MSNELIKLLKLYPNKNWDYENLSSNPNITWSYIKNTPHKKWNYYDISHNPNIGWEVIKNSNKYCNYFHLLYNPNVLELMRNNPNIKWYYEETNIIINNIIILSKKWSSLNPDIISNLINFDINKSQDYVILLSPAITWDLINADSDIKWHYDIVSLSSPTIAWDMVSNNPEECDYQMLSSNPNITLEFIVNNLDKEWNYSELSSNPAITWDIIINNPDINWDYESFSCNPNLTMEIVRDNPQIEWDYEQISLNKFQLNKDLIFINNKTKILLEYLEINLSRLPKVLLLIIIDYRR